MSSTTQQPKLTWEWGTAYDLFVSLSVLYKPGMVGVRSAWAAGIRSRLSEEVRDTLEKFTSFLMAPLPWIHTLPPPKDATAVLWALRQIPPAERLPRLMECGEFPPECCERLEDVATRGAWKEADRDFVLACEEDKGKDEGPPPKAEIENVLNAYANAGLFGERLLAGLQSYYEVFFREEEKRIEPYLKQAISRAQALAEELPLLELIEELSRGVSLPAFAEVEELILIPSFWITPLIMMGRISPERQMFMFGARPADVSVVPGEVVPEALVQALKALSDPTRLRILYYLTAETLTTAQLARRLRLRAPTVTHHLRTLRLAELVHVTLEEGKEQFYAARPAAIDETFAVLKRFLNDREG
jgi:DNA-binding transcriptional ArsR family regulator